jgi:hypothetical protein
MDDDEAATSSGADEPARLAPTRETKRDAECRLLAGCCRSRASKTAPVLHNHLQVVLRSSMPLVCCL